jgi:hypothetical protein
MPRAEAGAVDRGPVHDVSLVEQAISGRQRRLDAVFERVRAAEARLGVRADAEAGSLRAPARVAELMAQGRRALLFGVAAALVILAIGIAARLAQRPPAPPAPAPAAAAWPAPLREGVAAPPDRPDVIVRDYVIFSEARTTVAGTEFLVMAGHRFETEQAESFSTAWCYTKRFVGGVEVNLALGDLAPGGIPAPTPATLSDGSRRTMGLSAADAAALFRHCPWLQVGP